jgi:hypothetical protein
MNHSRSRLIFRSACCRTNGKRRSPRSADTESPAPTAVRSGTPPPSRPQEPRKGS